MITPHSPRWQQFRSNRFDVASNAHAPISMEHALLYGAGASALVFLALWYGQGAFGFPDLSSELDQPTSYDWKPRARPPIQPAIRAKPRTAAVSTPRASTPVPPVQPARRLQPSAARRSSAPQPSAAEPEPLDLPLSGPADMDLSNAPLSPLEQLAQYAKRAHDRASLSNMTIDPPHMEPATLRINSRPWAHVFIDGRLVGHTPLRAFTVGAGSHTVRLDNPDFRMSKSFTLEAEAGEVITRVESLDP